jgi:hypothetical protein
MVPPLPAAAMQPPAPAALAGAAVGGYGISGNAGGYSPAPTALSYGTTVQLGQVDTTSLVAANDQRRALTLISEYDAARRTTADARAAGQSFSQQLQQRRFQQVPAGLDPQTAQRQAAGEQLLIVQCDVTPEALERGLAPVLAREQIVDLTPTESSTNAAPAPAEREATRAAKAGEEQFLYVVAGAPQLAGVLEAIRNEPQYFVNVEITPAGDNAQQRAWSDLSRGVVAGGSAGQAAKPAMPSLNAVGGTTARKNAAVDAPSAGELKKGNAPADGPIAKSAAPAAERLDEVKQTTPASSAIAGVASPADGLKQALGKQSPGGMPQLVLQPPAVQQQVDQQLGLQQQVAMPLNRAQRLSPQAVDKRSYYYSAPRGVVAGDRDAAILATDASALRSRNGNAPTADGKTENEKEKLAANSAAVPQAAAKTDGIPKAQGAASSNTPVAAAKVDKAREEAQAKFGEKSSETAALKDGAGVGGGGRAALTQREVAEAGAAEAPWYGVPPDYHEALFIFRVVNQPAKSKSE